MWKKTKNYLLNKKHIALVTVDSNINKNATEIFRADLQSLNKNKKLIEAVGLVVNSNGGSAVHSELISSSIKQFCEINKLKLFTFAENYAVSGGYWILCVGDEVYANHASIIGSIGVIFGTVDLKSLLERRNISRRYFTSKNDDKSDFNKVTDLFTDISEKDQECINKILTKCHGNFKDHVLKYRGNKITYEENIRNEIFNANVYLGEKGQEVGLIDGLGDYKSVFEHKYKGVEIVKYSNEYRYLKGSNISVFSKLFNAENLTRIGEKLLKI